ncbi:transcriptional activator TAF-1-like [Arachis ipaensis]|uniref:transcriptional activator TAF-1-like n=1 Tax=Arachis ipaensis TaxID=130454 RepID=UPI0007AFAD70|nr:transcriptional activator TAF-1-like [Arachis ipaensis]XP_025647028.1 transcriptional activator TAF-1-like [Arachis hypogaea]
MSIGNGHTDSTELRTENKLSQSVDTGGSSDGSDGNTVGANQTPRKRSCERTPATSMTLFFTKCHILMNNRVVLGSQLSF